MKALSGNGWRPAEPELIKINNDGGIYLDSRKGGWVGGVGEDRKIIHILSRSMEQTVRGDH